MVVTVTRPGGPGQRISARHGTAGAGQGTWWPAARASSYHSGRVNGRSEPSAAARTRAGVVVPSTTCIWAGCRVIHARSEEHTSELQSRFDLVCRLLLEKKKKQIQHAIR